MLVIVSFFKSHRNVTLVLSYQSRVANQASPSVAVSSTSTKIYVEPMKANQALRHLFPFDTIELKELRVT
jgi:hypothetical protein